MRRTTPAIAFAFALTLTTGPAAAKDWQAICTEYADLAERLMELRQHEGADLERLMGAIDGGDPVAIRIAESALHYPVADGLPEEQRQSISVFRDTGYAACYHLHAAARSARDR